ncbi:hypothetical protein PanWU01x14_116260 [Parasponia andersonii]|uniref:DDT domain-containing protein DDR4 n=1 Tax=Parasponia andersonii TaxID=3476 RepID=A0A2P5CX43_PARAD|nr:hypothetical protein PanWU01x14_116260 [Parasponia andersonii]
MAGRRQVGEDEPPASEPGDDAVERGQKCILKPGVAELRGRWELASVLNFLTVFKPVIGKELKISAEEIETGLINPDVSLAKLHITLLKGIPPVTKALDGSDAWVTVLCKKLSPWWPWVAEGEIPLVASKGEEISRYKGLDPTKRLLILKALCEIRADQDDAVAYINDDLKQGTQISSFRKDKIGGDGNGTSFWFDGNAIIGYRLYREVTTFGTKTKSVGKECLNPPCFQWDTLATNLDQFRKVADEFSSSKLLAEAAVGRTVETDAIPVLEKLQKSKEREMKRKQRQEMFLNDGRSSCAAAGARVTRSGRNLRPVNYTFEDYDRAMKEAIQIQETKKRTSPEDEEEREDSEIATERKTDLEDHSPKRNSSEEDNVEDSDVDIGLLQDVGSDEDDDDDFSGKGDADDSGFRDSATSEVDRNRKKKKQKQTSRLAEHFGVRWSQRLVGGTGQPSVGNKNLRAKNILRQRPTRNSALDTIVIPDSDDES